MLLGKEQVRIIETTSPKRGYEQRTDQNEGFQHDQKRLKQQALVFLCYQE